MNNNERIAGVSDAHPGDDYLVPLGSYIVLAAPTSRVFYVTDEGDDVHLMFFENDGVGTYYETNYGHLETVLVQQNQTAHRGQIIAISGDRTAYEPLRIPQLHFNLGKVTPPQDGWRFLDPFRYTVSLVPKPVSFSGNEASCWTKDNDPQFPLVSLGD